MIFNDAPAIADLVPNFLKRSDMFQPHQYYYSDLDHVDSNPEMLIKFIQRNHFHRGFHRTLEEFRKKVSTAELRDIWNAIDSSPALELMESGEIHPDNDNYQTSQLIDTHGVFTMHSDSYDFDFGMSAELLALLGLVKETQFLVENFERRKLYRMWLNGIFRDAKQLALYGPTTLAHFYTTGRNAGHGAYMDFESYIDVHTKTTEQSLFPGDKIYKFGKTFIDNARGKTLSLISIPESQNFNKYYSVDFLNFLDEVCQITPLTTVWPSLIVRTKSKSLIEVMRQIPQSDFREFLRIFYKDDAVIRKKLEADSSKFLPLAAHDIVAFMLWYCYRGMPMGRQIISQVPPKLNPYTDFWIYTNIIDEEIVSRQFGKLLAMCTTPHNLAVGDQAEVVYNFPLFKNLSVKTLTEIEIFIATRFGSAVPFIDGPSTVQLLFKAT